MYICNVVIICGNQFQYHCHLNGEMKIHDYDAISMWLPSMLLQYAFPYQMECYYSPMTSLALSFSSFIFLAKNRGSIFSYPRPHFYFLTYAEYIVINLYINILTDLYVFIPIVI
jgi:hypothetical protein